MIPDFISNSGSLWPLLPPGIHDSDMNEIYARFVYNRRRKELYEGLVRGLQNLFNSGCPQVYLDGSYVTEKPLPNDYDLCWDSTNVDPDLLDPVFLEFDNGRASQKLKYMGEYFPTFLTEGATGTTFLEFFQIDKATGKPKGIIRIKNFISKGGLYDN